MNKYYGLTIICFFAAVAAFSQIDSFTNKRSLIFEQLTTDLKEYRLDTTAVPDDSITAMIKKLRTLRGGFNINEAIEYKLEEARQKQEMTQAEFTRFSDYFKTGIGKKWLDNSVIWIYRQYFTYQELKQLVEFYKTSAGKKMAANFPIIMAKSIAAAELIKNKYIEEQKK